MASSTNSFKTELDALTGKMETRLNDLKKDVEQKNSEIKQIESALVHIQEAINDLDPQGARRKA